MAAILIVDDEPEIATLLRVVLEKEGFAITEASNGQVALERLGIDPPRPGTPLPDLIVLDIMMPVMDGYALNTRLQADPNAKNIPVVVLTAKGQKMRDLFEVAPNVAAYLQKPFDPKTLRELIAGIIAKRANKGSSPK
ncbi:MAG: response regulator [Elusimicrobia bacterium]|nr:response regulator [Elusimicrobiota bacterium]